MSTVLHDQVMLQRLAILRIDWSFLFRLSQALNSVTKDDIKKCFQFNTLSFLGTVQSIIRNTYYTILFMYSVSTAWLKL